MVDFLRCTSSDPNGQINSTSWRAMLRWKDNHMLDMGLSFLPGLLILLLNLLESHKWVGWMLWLRPGYYFNPIQSQWNQIWCRDRRAETALKGVQTPLKADLNEDYLTGLYTVKLLFLDHMVVSPEQFGCVEVLGVLPPEWEHVCSLHRRTDPDLSTQAGFGGNSLCYVF